MKQSSGDHALFAVKANLAVILRGDVNALAAFADELERLAPERGLVIVHKQASASRLWVKEGDRP